MKNGTKKIAAMAMVYLMLFFSTSMAWAGGGGGGSAPSPSINPYLTRLAVEEQLRQQVVRVVVSIWNAGQSYSAEAGISPDGWATLKLENPKPGAYSMYVSELIERDGTSYSAFESKSEIVIREGEENIFLPKPSLIRELPVTFLLPADLDINNNERLDLTAIMPDSGTQGLSWSTSQDNKKRVTVYVPIETVELKVGFKGKEYTVTSPFLLGAIAYNSGPLELSAFPVKTMTSLIINVSLLQNYLVAGVDYKTIQATIDAASPNQTVIVKPGFYNEQVRFKDNVPVIGDPTSPQSVVIVSDQSYTVKAEIGGNYSVSGVTIRNDYTGKKNWSTAAVLTDLGPKLKMDHCIVEVTGTADPIANNYSNLELSNVTIKGSGAGTGINSYNNGSNSVFKNLLMLNLENAIRQDNGKPKISQSLFWQVNSIDIQADSSNVWGDPQLNWDYPNLYAPAVKHIMSFDGNYPGALRPVPAPESGEKG